MPKYWGKQIFTHGRFPEVGQKQKTERERKRKKEERLNDGNNNGQATHGARKHAWCTQAAWAKKYQLFISLIMTIRKQKFSVNLFSYYKNCLVLPLFPFIR